MFSAASPTLKNPVLLGGNRHYCVHTFPLVSKARYHEHNHNISLYVTYSQQYVESLKQQQSFYQGCCEVSS